jgi:hypothetical protein
MDLFALSIPFLIQKVTQMLYHVIKPQQEYIGDDMPINMTLVRYLEAMLLENHKNTEKNMELTRLDGDCPDDRLLETGRYLETKQDGFEEKKLIDLKN